MNDNAVQVEHRVNNTVRDLLVPALFPRRAPVRVTAWEVPDEPVPFAEAVRHEFTPFEVGQAWSRPWGTTWFHVTGSVPDGWGRAGTTVQLFVDLGFSRLMPAFQAEGLLYRPDGSIIKGVEPFNHVVDVDGDTVDVFVEAASNPNMLEHFFASAPPTPAAGMAAALPGTFLPAGTSHIARLGHKATAGSEPVYTLRDVTLVERDLDVDALLSDISALVGLARELDPGLPRRAGIVRALERACDAIDPDDVAATVAAARGELAAVLAAPAHATAHSIVAVGHAHLDSAWLWPTRETVRKCARTFSNVLDLMDADPDFVFACSSAQQLAWVKEYYPQLFERIRARVAEGRFVPVGGMWVESDTNMPGGEALVRQFLHGQGFFLREFGTLSREAWLPDSFGFTAAFPQIARSAGTDSFLTQKMSWNDTNRMPHHTFLWEGLDGTRLFTHFPPNDTYGSDLGAADLAKAQRQHTEKATSNTSVTLFGWSDGGGGPTREMIAAARRTRDLEGSPRVTLGAPADFFAAAKENLPRPAVWTGEMYLETHRGTYTSQARTKLGNRRSEHLLREAELWSATAAVRGLLDYPYERLDTIWHTVLLQQFHDILPGSAIAWVHEEAEEAYRRVGEELEGIIASAQRALAGDGGATVVFNAAPFDHGDVPALGAAVLAPQDVAAGQGAGPGAGPGSTPNVAPAAVPGGYRLDNGRLSARFDAAGLLVSLVDLSSGRDLVPDGEQAALLQVFRDRPNMFEAWDIDRSYANAVTELRTPDTVEVTGDALTVTHTHGGSTIVQRFRLAAGAAELQVETEVDWHEQEKLLKLAFPVDVRADDFASEIQFGHVMRPTFANTSWDAARFETVAHRWVHVGEPGFGVAVANASTYGHDVTRSTRDDGGTTTLVRQSLLRAPKFPDPEADQGAHVFRTTIGPAATVLDAAAAGYRLNLPARHVPGDPDAVVDPIVTVSAPSVLVESVKLAEDRSGDLVVRLYEAQGARTAVTLGLGTPFSAAWRTDLLERDLGEQSWAGGEPIGLELRPFQIATVRVRTTS
ncbi:glycoside hydrolase family 38 C-terminal domain-containing protein [Promicromonospora sp. MEB111]|uniref:alpha-mannosidase n=1 Tax=Promicromonospora sp. MEB111 TaxID=3040301 RepID=UPI00254E324C|nr:glycoside hydrolase family 38 C-terminal domain-containing protein [Promicromonospora sp. MEB111]